MIDKTVLHLITLLSCLLSSLVCLTVIDAFLIEAGLTITFWGSCAFVAEKISAAVSESFYYLARVFLRIFDYIKLQVALDNVTLAFNSTMDLGLMSWWIGWFVIPSVIAALYVQFGRGIGPQMLKVSCGHSSFLLEDGRVLIIGGVGDAKTTTEIYDPKTNSFTMGPNLPSGRWSHSASTLSTPFTGDILTATKLKIK